MNDEHIEIVYFGTSEHSIILLEAIKNSHVLKLKLVVTKPDKPVGRKKTLTPSPVKKWCLENSIPFITPASLKKEAKEVLEALKNHKTRLAVVADYGLLIPKEIIDFYELGIVNIHFSLLPKYRGATPVAYALLQGEKVTGVTFLLTTVEMDKGDIIRQIPFEIPDRENDQTLYQKLFVLAGQYIEFVLNNYSKGYVTLKKQNEEIATYCTPSQKLDRTTLLSKDDARIDFSKTPEEIERAVRAFFPWPVAWTTMGELTSYLKASLRNLDDLTLRIKVHKAHLEQGHLIIDELQPEGKRTLTFEEFKNGYLN